MANEMVYDRELLETLREWWQRYGLSVVVLGTVAAVGAGAWQWRERATLAAMQAASDDYEALTTLVVQWGDAEADERPSPQRIIAAVDTLRDAYPDSYYAHYAQLLKVRFLVRGGDLEEGLLLLEQLVSHIPVDSDLQELLIMRRARLLAELGRYGEAERMLRSSPQLIYPQEYQLLLGDMLRRRGLLRKAMQAYASAVRLYQGQERHEDIPVSLRLHVEALSSALAAQQQTSTGTFGIDIDAAGALPTLALP